MAEYPSTADAASEFEQAYTELCHIARRNRFVGPSVDALEAQELVHETYLRLRKRFFELPERRRCDPADFLVKVALAMRTVARDCWRSRTAARRGGTRRSVVLDETRAEHSGAPGGGVASLDTMALYEAMDRLQLRHPLWFDVVRRRYLEGRTVAETGRLLGIDPADVRGLRRRALTWLRLELRRE